ncbi:MAG: dienelactone hydrolase family protein [Gammaproteobacteria bacterium]
MTTSTVRGPALAGFEQFFFESHGMGHPVYRSGNERAPMLLLLQEIAGFSPGLLLFARRLTDAGFQVCIPWIFGPFGRRAPVRNALRLCVSREFANLREGVSAPIATWLRALAAQLSERNGGARIGAIGMCLTGAFAIPLVIEPGVAAAVAAQPSVPLSFLHLAFGTGSARRLGALNVADTTIAEARARLESGDAHMMAVRCRADRICPRAKLERFMREFPVGLEVREYGNPDDRNRVGERPHATFTKEYRIEPEASSDHHSRRAFADLVAFFGRHLRAS